MCMWSPICIPSQVITCTEGQGDISYSRYLYEALEVIQCAHQTTISSHQYYHDLHTKIVFYPFVSLLDQFVAILPFLLFCDVANMAK